MSGSAAFARADRNDPCPCGSGKKFKKCCMDKVAQLQPNISQVPNVGMLLQQAGAALNAGQFTQAEMLLKQVLVSSPKNTDALNLLAYAYLQMQRLAEAEKFITASLAINDKNGMGYFIAGMIAKARRNFPMMEQFLLKAEQHKPVGYMAQIYANLGDCMHELRRLPEAISYYNQAIAIDANNAKAYFFRSMARYDMEGITPQMEEDAQQGIRLAPHDIMMLCKLGGIYSLKHDFEKAYPLLEKAVQINPNSEEALFFFATCLQERGSTEEAAAQFNRLMQAHPNSVRGQVGDAFLFPTIPASNAEIDKWRARFEEKMDAMVQRGIVIPEPERQGFYLPFYQSYHGRDNTQLNQKMAEFFAKTCPSTQVIAPHCKHKPTPKERIRVGFVSDLFYSPLLTQFFGELIVGLANHPQFEVVIFAYSARHNEAVESLTRAVQRYVVLPVDLAGAQQAVSREEVDILIFLDVGMRLPTYLLAMGRLAHIQGVMGGHPITTGIPNMDIFFTTGCMEKEGAQAHYSERLVAASEMLAVFKRKYIEEAQYSRAELGLPDNGEQLYTCPVLLFKLHPDMDIIFEGILKKDAKARIILFDAGKIIWRQKLEERFHTNMGADLAERVLFVPFAAADKFIHTMRAMDAIFDTLHFSFGTTAFQLLGSNVPFVTKPSEFLRGRGAYGMFKMMDMLHLTADTTEGYIELIVKLANDKAFQAQVKQQIVERSDVIFDTYEAVNNFNNALQSLYAEKCI